MPGRRSTQQLRDSLLDVQAAQELVRVSRSNVELATKSLEQVTDRFQAGIDDNLPVVTAQSTWRCAEPVGGEPLQIQPGETWPRA